jgi:AcrR family transcriptional regulator
MAVNPKKTRETPPVLAADATSPPSKLTRIEKGERSREAILESAIFLFAHHGYDAVSLDDIARYSGVNRPLILYYYRSKFEVWRAAAETVISDFNTAMERRVAKINATDEDVRLRLSVGAWLDGFIEKPECAKFLVREAATPGPRLEWLVKQRGVHLLEIEFLKGAGAPRRAVGRAVVNAIFMSFAAIAPLLEISMELAANRKPAGIHPLSRKNREELIELVALIVSHSRGR